MKPLVRWTVGPTYPEAIQCLRLSITRWRSLYSDAWDYVVCHNGSRPTNLPSYVDMIRQEDYLDTYSIGPSGPAWKLYPTRLRPDGHEILLDNEILFYKRHPLVEEFIDRRDVNLATEAWNRSYGIFDKNVPDHLLINTGLIGLSPQFDLERQIQGLIDSNRMSEWKTHFCEQGAVASCLGDVLVIPRADVAVGIPHEPYCPGTHGTHFVGLNYGHNEWWKAYLASLCKVL